MTVIDAIDDTSSVPTSTPTTAPETTSTTSTTDGVATRIATVTENGVAPIDLEAAAAFAMKVAGDQAISNNAVLGYLGDRLGLWRTLASVHSVTSESLAARTGLAERYLREWLAAQAAAGYLDYDPADRSFRLTPERALVLADDDSPVTRAGMLEFTASIWAGVDRLASAFASGEGIGWRDQDPRVAIATERAFRPLYSSSLLQHWVPAVPGLANRLQAGARVLDVGCGFGTATVMLGRAFEASTVEGIDDHDESIRLAAAAAHRAGVSDRVTFRLGSTEGAAGERYDVVFFFDALHDMGDPVGALRWVRDVLEDDGIVVCVEPAAPDALEDNLNPLGMSWYVSSTTVCVPGSLSQPGQAALGTQAGPAALLDVFAAAGFSDAQVVATTLFNQVLTATR